MTETSSSAATVASNYLPVRQSWLDRRREPILDPDLPIVDPHHHLWDRPGWRYLPDEMLADTNGGPHCLATGVGKAAPSFLANRPPLQRPACATALTNWRPLLISRGTTLQPLIRN